MLNANYTGCGEEIERENREEKEREKSFIEKRKISGKKCKNGRRETEKEPIKAVRKNDKNRIQEE